MQIATKLEWSKKFTPSPPAHVVLFASVLALGVIGDLASGAWIDISAPWVQLLRGCHYLAVILAAIGSGPKVALAAGVVVSIARIAVGVFVCGQSILEQHEVAAFIMAGLLVGLIVTPGQGREMRLPAGFVQTARNPLSAIESAGYLLEDPPLPNETQRELAAIIVQECHRLDVLISSLDHDQVRAHEYREFGRAAEERMPGP